MESLLARNPIHASKTGHFSAHARVVHFVIQILGARAKILVCMHILLLSAEETKTVCSLLHNGSRCSTRHQRIH